MTTPRNVIDHCPAGIAREPLPSTLGLGDDAFKGLLWLTGAKLPGNTIDDPEKLDWQGIIELAYEQRMLPIVHDRIVAEMKRLAGYENHIRLLQNAQRENARRNLALAAETLRVLDALAAGGIPALAFKGCILSAIVYGNIAARKGGDIDLLVKKESVRSSMKILSAGGYCLYYERTTAELRGHLLSDCELEMIQVEKRIGVDLHWEFSAKNSGLPVPSLLKHLWTRQQTVNLCGRRVNSPVTEDLVLMLCIHAAKHYWQRLEWILTLTLLINRSPQIDWQELCKTADECGADRILTLGLIICDETYGIDVPEQTRRRMRTDKKAHSMARKAWDWLINSKSDTLNPATLRKFNADSRSKPLAKIYYWVAASVTPTAKDYTVALPGWLSWGYYLTRIGRLCVENLARFFVKSLDPAPRAAMQWIPKPEIIQAAERQPKER